MLQKAWNSKFFYRLALCARSFEMEERQPLECDEKETKSENMPAVRDNCQLLCSLGTLFTFRNDLLLIRHTHILFADVSKKYRGRSFFFFFDITRVISIHQPSRGNVCE